MDPEDLVDIEALKQLKARYCRLLDAKDWPAWRQLFTDDFVSDTSIGGWPVIHGADDFVAFTRDSSAQAARRPRPTRCTHPELELISPSTARGIWALEDVVRLAPGRHLRGYGHYHETYEKVDGEWFIKTSTLTRLREDVFTAVRLGIRLGPDETGGRTAGPKDGELSTQPDPVLVTGAFGQVGRRCTEILLGPRPHRGRHGPPR